MANSNSFDNTFDKTFIHFILHSVANSNSFDNTIHGGCWFVSHSFAYIIYIYIYIYDYTYSFWYMICFIECHRVIYFLCELLFYLKLPSVLGGVLFFTFSMPDSVFFCTLLNNREYFSLYFFPWTLDCMRQYDFSAFIPYQKVICLTLHTSMQDSISLHVIPGKKVCFTLRTISEKAFF